jgi:hypothetical protein
MDILCLKSPVGKQIEERMVRSVKTPLQIIIILNSSLTFRQMSILLSSRYDVDLVHDLKPASAYGETETK